MHNGSLPDYFSTELNLHISADPEENLRELAKLHRALSGMKVNWLGTYKHAARIWQKGLEHKKNSRIDHIEIQYVLRPQGGAFKGEL